MRFPVLLALTGTMLSLTTGSTLRARTEDPPISDEIKKLEAEKARLTAEKNEKDAQLLLYKAMYELDLKGAGPNGNVNADTFASLSHKAVANHLGDCATLIIEKLGKSLEIKEILLSDKPKSDLVIKRTMFDVYYEPLLVLADKYLKDPSTTQIEEVFNLQNQLKPKFDVHTSSLTGPAVSSGLSSIAAIIKLFQSERTVTSTSISEIDDAFMYVMAGKIRKNDGKIKVYLDNKSLPIPDKTDLMDTNEMLITPIIAKLRLINDKIRNKNTEISKIEKKNANTKEEAEKNKVTPILIDTSDLSGEIQKLTECQKLISEFITTFNLDSSKGVSDLVIGKKLRGMKTLDVKILKSYGDTLKVKRWLGNDRIYVSYTISTRFGLYGNDGDLEVSDVVTVSSPSFIKVDLTSNQHFE